MDKKLILKYTTDEVFRCGMDSAGSELDPLSGCCEHGS